jgi:CRISPR-associated protein Csm2
MNDRSPRGNFRPGGDHGRHSGSGSYRTPSQSIDTPGPKLSELIGKINLSNPTAETFDTTAEAIAKELEIEQKNKSSQLRRFYDEIIRWSDKHRPGSAKESFEKDLPFIRMICAQAAYAKTRGHIDANFVAFLQGGVRMITNAEELRTFRSLFEAVIGFMPKQN